MGAQVMLATDGVHVYMRTDEVTLVPRNTLVAYLRGKVDRLQFVCSSSALCHRVFTLISVSVHIYMCVHVCACGQGSSAPHSGGEGRC
jgi:hypothetical protein